MRNDLAPNRSLDKAIVESFLKTHDGWSTDEVILQDGLREAFVGGVRERLSAMDIDAAEINWRLINLRKAGKLRAETTRTDMRGYEHVTHIGEIAARTLHDRHQVSTDRMMTDPDLRSEFDELAESIDAQIDPYLVRKAAFRLRKTRQLKPELITRVADWDREVLEFSAAVLAENIDPVPENPGVYIFRDATGYLYIGEAENLRTRLQEHLDESDRQSLASYLNDKGYSEVTVEVHSFDPESRAREVMVRRAYESELIRSRKPRFNIRP